MSRHQPGSQRSRIAKSFFGGARARPWHAGKAVIMLETLDPMYRMPADPDDRGRGVSEVAVGPRRAAAGADQVGAMPWSSDWLQLSHELRTPLNAILGNIELLLDGSAGPLAAPVRACVGDIQVASRQLLRQLQPLLLLVQARTAGALASSLPIDLLALVRQAAADRSPGPHPRAAQGQHAIAGRGEPCLPEGTCLMVVGDPVWLGALAAALVDLRAAAADASGPPSIALELSGQESGQESGEQPGGGAGGIVIRASWPGFEPAAVSPLTLALIDAVLALHGGRIRSLSADGLRLDLPGATVVRRSMLARGCR
jgi:hypothetical protein